VSLLRISRDGDPYSQVEHAELGNKTKPVLPTAMRAALSVARFGHGRGIMLKTFAIAASLGALATLTIAPTAAAAATTDYNVQIKQRPAILHHNGSATAVFWLRCKAGFNAFEYNVELTQGDSSSGTGSGGAFILTCDGTRHKVKVTLGSGLHPGPADISVNVQMYDPFEDHDVEAVDDATVRLRFRAP
jgi:hypothetical protein